MDELAFIWRQWLGGVDPTVVVRQNAQVGGEVLSKHQQVWIHTWWKGRDTVDQWLIQYLMIHSCDKGLLNKLKTSM